MDYPPNKKHEVVLNGIVVGTVKTTGDIETDQRIVTEFLTKKGLYKEVNEIKALFRQAVSFSTTAAYLHQRGILRSPWDPFCVAPFVVNSAFSIELYLQSSFEDL